MTPLSTETLLFALLGGVVPAVLWLLFWLREDRLHPEPRGLIMLAFLAGMVAVPLVRPLEEAVYTYAGQIITIGVVILWATIEEVMKFIVAYVVVLRNKEVNEPIDVMIYMITVALGFSALENTLFLLSPLQNGFLVESVLTGNLRFIGATLLHTVASATVGATLAFSFWRSRVSRGMAVFVGLILASALHALFNSFILKSDGGNGLLLTFFVVWLGIIFLILVFESVKRIKRTG